MTHLDPKRLTFQTCRIGRSAERVKAAGTVPTCWPTALQGLRIDLAEARICHTFPRRAGLVLRLALLRPSYLGARAGTDRFRLLRLLIQSSSCSFRAPALNRKGASVVASRPSLPRSMQASRVASTENERWLNHATLSFYPVYLAVHHRQLSSVCLRLSGPPLQRRKMNLKLLAAQLEPMQFVDQRETRLTYR